MKIKIDQIVEFTDGRIELVISGINQFSISEIRNIITQAFKRSTPKSIDDYEFEETPSFKLVKQYYRVPQEGEEELIRFKQPKDILRDLRPGFKSNPKKYTVTAVNIGIALNQLGYIRFSRRINGTPRYGYNVIPLF